MPLLPVFPSTNVEDEPVSVAADACWFYLNKYSVHLNKLVSAGTVGTVVKVKRYVDEIHSEDQNCVGYGRIKLVT